MKIFILLLFLLALPGLARADCAAPPAKAGTMDYFGAPENTFKFCNGTAWIVWGAGGGSGGGLKLCVENENCSGTPVLCGAYAPDFSGVMDVAGGGAITFGSWSNAQCGISGTGWHADSVSSCGTGTGTKDGRCRWILVNTGSGGGN